MTRRLGGGLAAALAVGFGRWYFSEEEEPGKAQQAQAKLGSSSVAVAYEPHRVSAENKGFVSGSPWPALNPPMMIVTGGDISIGPLAVPQGIYRLLIIARANEWTLKINGPGASS